MTRPSVQGRSGWWLPVIAVVLVLLALLPGSPRADDTVGPPRTAEAHAVTVACPVQSGLEIVMGQLAAGESVEAFSVPKAKVNKRWSDPSTWRRGGASAGALVMTQNGEGSGPVAHVAGEARTGIGGGLLFTRCPGLIDEGWIVGLDARRSSILQLANLGEATAVVDVEWWTSNGPVPDVDGRGLTIEPGKTRIIKVGEEVPGESLVAVHVDRRRQQVSVIGLDAGNDGKGTSMVLPQARPGRELVLPGIPDRGSVSLALVNPGEDTAHAQVRALGADGAFQPQGLDEIVVEPGTTKQVSVPRSASMAGRSLQVTSDEPLVASALVRTKADLAFVNPVEALTSDAIVPIKVDKQQVTLSIAAPGESASVTIESVDKNMKTVDTKQVSVAAGSTTTVDLARQFSKAAGVRVRSEQDVHVGAWIRSGDRIASTPVAPAPVDVTVPTVVVR